jgi:4-hydroxyphenylpyruvate dioxygenase
MKLSIATVSLSGSLEEKLEAIAGAGFKGVEIFENDLLSFGGTPADVRRRCADLGLEIVTFQPFRDFEGLPAEKRVRAFARAERKFDLMAELGCDLLMVCSSTSPESLGGVDRAAADFRELGERAAKRKMRVAFEALAWGRHISDYRDAWEVVRRADHANVGLVLDSFHTFAKKTDLGAMRSIPGNRIFLVQMADAPILDMDILSWSRHFRNFPGQGDFPLVDFMAALQATGFDGPLSLEIFNDQFRAGSARRVAVDGRRSLIFLRDRLRERDGILPVGQAPLPPRSRCLGTAFIEFAMDETAAAEFDGLLRGLGFVRAGVHRSKAVTRWTQGAINIVVNTEQEGFAHSFNITHGTGVCAIGLEVTDAAATLDRAQRLLDHPFRQAVGPNELEIPAVRGLGGSLVYFIDPKSELARVWDIEFDATGETGNTCGLARVDHISQSMHYEEMLTWLLFYTSLLDLEKSAEQDVIDPGGLVKSQVIQAADGRLRLVLNASQSARTQSSRFLADAFGSGVQHIAFVTDDLLATVKRMTANGIKLLPIPENYYDDLEAKTDLSAERIDELKAHNILYDREGAGEFLQAYTRTFDDRFFFEIVERRDYVSFGAANAPIRLAAQARAARPAAMPRA